MGQRNAYYNWITLSAMPAFALYSIAMQKAAALGAGLPEGRLCCFCAALAAPAVPLLIIGAGGRFLGGELSLSVKRLVCVCLPRLAAACVFWWVLAALLNMKAEYPAELDSDTFFECLSAVLDPPFCMKVYHLFFVMALFYPLLKKAALNPAALRYGLLVSLALCVVNPLLSYIPVVSIVTLFTNQINWGFFSVYMLYLFLGLLVGQREIAWPWRVLAYTAGGLCTAASYMLTVISTVSLGRFTDEWISESSALVLVQSLAVLILLRRLSRRGGGAFFGRLVGEWGSCGFSFVGAFAVSGMLVAGAVSFDGFPAALDILFRLLLCGAISLLVCFGMKRLPLLSFLTHDLGEDTV